MPFWQRRRFIGRILSPGISGMGGDGGRRRPLRGGSISPRGLPGPAALSQDDQGPHPCSGDRHERDTLSRATLDLFAAGVDDVVRKPIHVREILARVEQSGAGTSASATAPRLASCGFFLTAGIRNSREFLCHCRGASAKSLNIWSITAAGASARPKSSIPSMEFSMRMSRERG